ncbi:DEAD/DEAH box helicase [Roseovarius sp. SCSIO 43702]|uniref:DEAD/DEAH box helicase n=1 Tax=Roseovarius sp. SCSIO 43702 TaxID=2823043 RepID=UPI001C737C92|nr:DEAD/DEAH box helicase [Roseovarius sp. SCSIO 43702]QYX56659.1 DEAD/DEAH box helicase [Roseovarius sp. SCSIO 43702]
MSDFKMLGLSDRLVDRLTESGITDPTPIQMRAIPEALNGRDLMGLAQTGTGKTAAFGLPLAQIMLSEQVKPGPRGVRGLVLAPTRELANQIFENLQTYLGKSHLRLNIVVGGKSLNMQVKRLERGTDILVATPGRLIDLMERRAIELGNTRFLVLDEADQMLDLGFIHALRKIAAALPAERQTMLFSATMPKQMNEIAQAYLTSPVRVDVSPPGKAADKITQSVHFVAQAEKTGLLKELLDEHREELALVFSRTKHGAERLKRNLESAGFAATSIHGNKSQGQRDRALQEFKDGQARVLVATDVAARGIDIPDVRHVYNYDLPNVPDSYVHRIGRTARAGAEGRAVAFCAPDEAELLRDIQKVLKMDVPVASGRPWEGVQLAANKGRPGGAPGKGRGRRPGRGRGRSRKAG